MQLTQLPQLVPRKKQLRIDWPKSVEARARQLTADDDVSPQLFIAVANYLFRLNSFKKIGRAFARQEKIAAEFGKSVRQIKRDIKALKNAGLIGVIQRGFGKSNRTPRPTANRS